MLTTLFAAAALSAAPAIQPPAADPHKDHAAHQGEAKKASCDMPCCKDKPMPCCEKMHSQKKAAAPAADGHGAHEHDH